MTPQLATADESALLKQMARANRVNAWIQGATVFILFATLVAAAFSAWFVKDATSNTIKIQSELSANETWSSFRDLEIDYLKEYKGEFIYPSGDEARDVAFYAVAERLLMAADMLSYYWEIDRDWRDPQWEDAFKKEFRLKKAYFLSEEFLQQRGSLMSEFCGYRRPVREWIQESLLSDRDVSAADRKRLTQANSKCNQELKNRNYPDA